MLTIRNWSNPKAWRIDVAQDPLAATAGVAQTTVDAPVGPAAPSVVSMTVCAAVPVLTKPP